MMERESQSHVIERFLKFSNYVLEITNHECIFPKVGLNRFPNVTKVCLLYLVRKVLCLT